MANEHPPFVTITHGMRGYFAVLMTWSEYPDLPQGFYEPWNSGFGSYKTYAEAVPEARQWAEAEECELKLHLEVVK